MDTTGAPESDKIRDLVKGAAASLGMLDAGGALVPLDSLMIVDLIVALEEAAGVTIPPTHLEPDAFQSIDSITTMLSRIVVEPKGASQ